MSDLLSLLAKRKAMEAQTDALATGKPVPPPALSPVAPPMPYGLPMFNQPVTIVEDTPLFIRDEKTEEKKPFQFKKKSEQELMGTAKTKKEIVQDIAKENKDTADKAATQAVDQAKASTDDLFDKIEKPKFDDLKEDLKAGEEYEGSDLLKMALIGTLPGIVGGLFGGLAGAAGAAPAGPKALEGLIASRKDKAKNKRELAKDEMKRRQDQYKDDQDLAYKRANLGFNRLKLAQELFGTNSRAYNDALKAAATFYNMEGKERLLDKQMEMADHKLEVEKQKAAIDLQKQADALTLAVQKNEMSLQHAQEMFKLQSEKQEMALSQQREKFLQQMQNDMEKFRQEMGQMKDKGAAQVEAIKGKTEAQVDAIKKKGAAAPKGSGKGSVGGKGLSGGVEGGNIIPGWQWNGKVKVSDSEVRTLRDGTAAAESLVRILRSVKSKTAGAGLRERYADPNFQKDIKQDLRDAQLAYKSKAFAELGVLAGPDLAILEDVIENPTSITSILSSGGEIAGRYDALIKKIEAGLGDKMAARGFSRGAKVPQALAPSEKPKFEYSPSRNKTRITYPDGRVEMKDGKVTR